MKRFFNFTVPFLFSAAGAFGADGTATPGGGVAFTAPSQSRTVWAKIEWVDEDGNTIGIPRHLHLHGDGREHRLYFDGATCETWTGNYVSGAKPEKWHGVVSGFRVVNQRTGEEVPVRDIEFCTEKPAIPPDLVLSHPETPLALDRAGRPVDIEVCVFNAGTIAATGVTVRVEGLPDCAHVANPEAAFRLHDLPGGDTLLHRVSVVADMPCTFTARIIFSGGNATEFVADVPVEIGPSLGLPDNLEYIPAPKPVLTAPCEVGAFYFPDWPRTLMWSKLWRIAPERRPALGWYSNLNPEVLDWQIKWAVENGISFYIVDWYGGLDENGKLWISGDYFEKAFAKARFRPYMKWALMWCNHLPPGWSREEVWTAMVRHWIDNYFGTPEYKFVDGMPYVSVWDGDYLERDNGPGGCRRMLDKARQMAREAGYKGIYFQAQCGHSPGDVKRMAGYGFDETTTYHYLGTGGRPPLAPKVGRFSDVADTSAAYWRNALAESDGIDFLANLSTGWNDHPWDDGFELRGRTVDLFRRICEDAKRFAAETGMKRVCVAPLNEWGEGSYAEPNGEFGFGMFEAVRDVFGIMPAEGWPTNYVPADIGRGPYPTKDDNGGPAGRHKGISFR